RGLAPIVDLALATGAAPAAANVDLAREVVLPDDIAMNESLEPPVLEPRRVLLTGGNGFVGAYLLRTLLTDTDADIYCLVRASSAAEGTRRLKDALEKYGLWEDLYAPR